MTVLFFFFVLNFRKTSRPTPLCGSFYCLPSFHDSSLPSDQMPSPAQETKLRKEGVVVEDVATVAAIEDGCKMDHPNRNTNWWKCGNIQQLSVHPLCPLRFDQGFVVL